eukprot:678684-Amphidinium_carterae.1
MALIGTHWCQPVLIVSVLGQQRIVVDNVLLSAAAGPALDAAGPHSAWFKAKMHARLADLPFVVEEIVSLAAQCPHL